MLDAGAYQRAEDEARAESERAAAEAGAESPSALAASDALVRALVSNGRGGRETTVALARRLVAIRERAPRRPDNVAALASSLVNLGEVLTASAD